MTLHERILENLFRSDETIFYKAKIIDSPTSSEYKKLVEECIENSGREYYESAEQLKTICLFKKF